MGKSVASDRKGSNSGSGSGADALISLLAAGEQALAAGEWQLAAEHFQKAVDQSDGNSPEAWDGLGWAAWWLHDEELTFKARMSAFRLYRVADERPAAARMAAWIAADTREFRGEEAAARGWMQRAVSLLDGQPEVPEHGWVALLQADLALNFDRDSAGSLPLCEQAIRIGRELGISDLEAVGLAQGGSCHVAEGRIEEGMRWQDEAIAIASSEDLHLPITEGWALCCMISTCNGIGDFQRAAEWCENTRRFTERWGGRQLLGVCRSSYGNVLATQGDWPAAEAELTGAVEDLRRSRPGMASGGLAKLGDLRARQGRDQEARELYEQAGPAGLIGLGALELDSDDPGQGVALAERALRGAPAAAILDRLPAQELLVQALIATGALERAAAELETVLSTAEAIGTPYVAARASLLGAEQMLAAGDPATARHRAEDAVDAFAESGAPFDVARARLGLARALAALGRAELAERERESAQAVFEELGAVRDAARAAEPLPAPQTDPNRAAEQEEEPGARSGVVQDAAAAGDGALDVLTPRELEVLRLIANGASDAKIAEELVISAHTVHRHVANIRNKLGLSSRAAAVAYATRSGLI